MTWHVDYHRPGSPDVETGKGPQTHATGSVSDQEPQNVPEAHPAATSAQGGE